MNALGFSHGTFLIIPSTASKESCAAIAVWVELTKRRIATEQLMQGPSCTAR